jgi:hypothetical protein
MVASSALLPSQLEIDGAEMVAHRGGSESCLLGDLLVCQPVGKMARDLSSRLLRLSTAILGRASSRNVQHRHEAHRNGTAGIVLRGVAQSRQRLG